jgi:hypothetical protein
MDVVEDRCPYLTPFPISSVNLISAPTSTGKTWLIEHFIKHRDFYFQQKPLVDILIVLCNPRVDWKLDDKDKDDIEKTTQEEDNQEATATAAKLVVETIQLAEFDPDEIVRPGQLVVFEDCQTITESIRVTINVLAHHLELATVFILCQGILGSPSTFPLLSICHRLILFGSSNSAVRLGKFVIQQFYSDQEIKTFLKAIISRAEQQKTTCLIELNQIAGPNQTHFIAIDCLGSLPEEGGIIFYPHPSKIDMYQQTFSDAFLEVDPKDKTAAATAAKNVPKGSFFLVPAENVILRKGGKKRKRLPGSSLHDSDNDDEEQEEDACARNWAEMVATLDDNVALHFKSNKIQLARTFAREILSNPEFCISQPQDVNCGSGEELLNKVGS